jgi:hypothetical protein
LYVFEFSATQWRHGLFSAFASITVRDGRQESLRRLRADRIPEGSEKLWVRAQMELFAWPAAGTGGFGQWFQVTDRRRVAINRNALRRE